MLTQISLLILDMYIIKINPNMSYILEIISFFIWFIFEYMLIISYFYSLQILK